MYEKKEQFTPEELATEEWRSVPGWEEFYAVSNLGRLKCLARKGAEPWRFYGRDRILSIRHDRWDKGYHRVCLRAKGMEPWGMSVHRLVAMLFIGAPPFAGAVVNHKNGVPWDNRVQNLEWITQAENTRDGLRRAKERRAAKAQRSGRKRR